MLAYRFKINFEEQEGFSRDIELKVDQTFLDFYNALAENLSLDKSVSSSFFLCDHRFRKKEEIFKPGEVRTRKRKKATEPDDQEQESKPLFMDKSPLNEFIDDPHQKFIFEYDWQHEWNFFIELFKISPAQSSETYPRIFNAVGGVPMEISKKPRPIPGVNDDEQDLDELDQEFDQEEERAGPDAYAEEDLDNIDDSGFYDDSPTGGEDFEQEK